MRPKLKFSIQSDTTLHAKWVMSSLAHAGSGLFLGSKGRQGLSAMAFPSLSDQQQHQLTTNDGQLTVYTDGSASAGNKDGGAGVIMTCGDPAAPTILHQSHLRGARFTSSFASSRAYGVSTPLNTYPELNQVSTLSARQARTW